MEGGERGREQPTSRMLQLDKQKPPLAHTWYSTKLKIQPYHQQNKQVTLFLTGQKRIFQASMKQGGHAMINSNNF